MDRRLAPGDARGEAVGGAVRHEDLLVRLAQGDAQALEEVVHEMYVPLCRFAYRMVGTHDGAEDVVAEALMAFWERVQRSGQTASIRSYLYQAVRNRALNAMRHDRRSATVALDEAVDVPTTVRRDTSDDLDRALRVAIDRLPERCRLTYILSREQGLAHAEIAIVMEVSVKTVEAQLTRALNHLRDALAPYLE